MIGALYPRLTYIFPCHFVQRERKHGHSVFTNSKCRCAREIRIAGLFQVARKIRRSPLMATQCTLVQTSHHILMRGRNG